MTTVATVWSGSGKYPRYYVDRLQAAAEQLLPNAVFRVITPASASPLREGQDGCWLKLELFRPGRFSGPVLFFDLDTVLVRDLSPLVSDGPFRARRDFARPTLSSATMSWIPGPDTEALWHEYQERRPFGKPSGDYKGDQDFIDEVLQGRYEPYPGEWILSVKKHLQSGAVDPREHEKCLVAAFHGKPKPDELDYDWIGELWGSLKSHRETQTRK